MASVPQAVPQSAIRRYSNTAVLLHWTTVLLVVAQALLGFAFADLAQGAERAELFTWHKTVGPLILVITLVRLSYRIANPPPPYSADLPKWERIAGTWNHRLFYLLLIVMPLTGLAAVSSRTSGAFTKLAFGIPFPVIPGISRSLGDSFRELHAVLALTLIGLIVLHAAAALKHQFIDRLPAAGRMPPFQPDDGSPVVVGQGGRSGESHK